MKIKDLTKNVLKLCLLGNGGVGKSTLLERVCTGRFNEITKMTIGIGFQEVHVVVKDGTTNSMVDVGVWDFGGEDQFRFILPKYVNGADGGLLMFDVNNYRTMIDLPEWLSIWRENTPPGTPILLVGTKSDTITKVYQPIIDNNIKLVKEQLKFDTHILTSSKSGHNIHEVISQITHEMLEFRSK